MYHWNDFYSIFHVREKSRIPLTLTNIYAEKNVNAKFLTFFIKLKTNIVLKLCSSSYFGRKKYDCDGIIFCVDNSF